MYKRQDQDVAKMLHQSGRDVLLLANKSDNNERDDLITEFASLGFPAYAVSALQNRGIKVILDLIIEKLPKESNKNAENILRVAIVGRPNSGKSSYINRLLQNERVIVSDIPGTTRDSVETLFTIGTGKTARNYKLIDTAGVQKKNKNQWSSRLV